MRNKRAERRKSEEKGRKCEAKGRKREAKGTSVSWYTFKEYGIFISNRFLDGILV